MRTPISDVISDRICSTKARSGATLHAPATGERHAHKSQHTWVMLVGNEFPIRRRTHQDQQRPAPDPSHTNSNRDSTNKGSRCTRHTLVHSNPIARRTPTTWSAYLHDLPQSPMTSTAHEPAPFLALRARRQSPLVLVVLDALRPPARRSLRRTQAPLIASDCL